MAADDHLNGAQFTVLYHGTRAAHASKIREEGLTSSANVGKKNLTLTPKKDEAGYFASMGAKSGHGAPAVVTFHIPTGSLDEYTEGHSPDSARGLRKPLPSSMVHKVEEF